MHLMIQHQQHGRQNETTEYYAVFFGAGVSKNGGITILGKSFLDSPTNLPVKSTDAIELIQTLI